MVQGKFVAPKNSFNHEISVVCLSLDYKLKAICNILWELHLNEQKLNTSTRTLSLLMAGQSFTARNMTKHSTEKLHSIATRKHAPSVVSIISVDSPENRPTIFKCMKVQCTVIKINPTNAMHVEESSSGRNFLFSTWQIT